MMIEHAWQLQKLVRQLDYRGWTFECDDAGVIWVRRREPDTTKLGEITLTNQVPVQLPADPRMVLIQVWAELERAEAHERLEKFKCACGQTVFQTHDTPDTQPPAGLARLLPSAQWHLCS